MEKEWVNMSQRLKYISRIKDEFDTVICGMNGIIMRGSEINTENLQALIKIYQSGKRLMLASNSGWRVKNLFYFLKDAGVPMNIFQAMITAGEIAHFALKNTQAYGTRYYALTSIAPQLMHGLQYQQVEDINDADFVVAATDVCGVNTEFCLPILAKSLQKKLPLFCVGNDTLLVNNDNICSGVGSLAEQYAMQGGTIIPFGKPDTHIAAYLCEHIKNFRKSRCLIIGDAMATDIRMGNAFGAQTLLITGGCHQIFQPTAEQINKLSAEYGLNIDYYMESLQW